MLRFLPRNPETPTPAELAALSPYGGITARLLWGRGLRTAKEADAFLHPSAEQLHDPFLLEGMDKAVSLLAEAKSQGLPTVVYGDYDVDGMCATALLCSSLERFGLAAAAHVPLRQEGYGLNMEAIIQLAQDYKLLITVDLGITNHEEVALAQELGMKVLVTDHHQLGLVPCPADGVLNPLLGAYPCPRLCGTGVAFKLAQALLGPEEAESFLDLAALATVADIVPLTGENRVLVALGLPQITAGHRPGIRALMKVSGASEADAYTLGFQLAPRLNAAGRLEDAALGVRLMMTQQEAQVEEMAAQLDGLNTRRRTMEAQVLESALTQAQAYDFVQNPALIVRGEGWPLGVVGLVAGRLCQRYGCPTAVLSQEGNMLHGSLRSVSGVNIHRCLQACDDLLTRYGGHEQAAGCTLAAGNYQAFFDRLQQAVRSAAGEEALIPAQEYDVLLPFQEATNALARELAQLAPFGMGNPAPLFLGQGLKLERRRACGADGSHLQLTLRQGAQVLDGIAFGMGKTAMNLPDQVDAVFSLKEDAFRGVTRLKCEVKAMAPAQGAQGGRLAALEDEAYATALLDGLLSLGPALEKEGKTSGDGEIIKVMDEESLPGAGRGVLYLTRTRQKALEWLQAMEDEPLELCLYAPEDPLCFATLLALPLLEEAKGCWRQVVLLDGEALPGEAALWQSRLSQAQVLVCPTSQPLRALAATIDAGDEAYRSLYKYLRSHACGSLSQAAKGAGLRESQCRAGLWAFAQLGLIHYTESPFSYALCPPAPCNLGDSPLLGALRRLAEA